MNDKEPNITINRSHLVLIAVIIVIVCYSFFHSYQKSQTDLISSQQQKIDAVNDELHKVQDLASKPDASDYSALVSEWSPRVVRIVCSDNDYISTGSGVLTRMSFSEAPDVSTVVTNKHVITDPVSGYQYTDCNFAVNTIANKQAVVNVDTNKALLLQDQDVAYFHESKKGTSSVTGMNVCSSSDVVIGDKIIILGYPSNGGTGEVSTAITVTDGLISSYDGEYYVTNAKIDHGNSGGAAILVKKDCYLGIPTWVQSGGFESLGRILKASFIFGN